MTRSGGWNLRLAVWSVFNLMMRSFFGSTLAAPFRADQRGTLVTTSDPDEIAAQYVRAVMETRQGERRMLPDFGLPDLVFEVAGPAFAARLAFHIEDQVAKYVPGVEIIEVRVGVLGDGEFTESYALNDGRVVALVTFKRSGAREPRSLTFPIWRLKNNGA